MRGCKECLTIIDGPLFTADLKNDNLPPTQDKYDTLLKLGYETTNRLPLQVIDNFSLNLFLEVGSKL